MILLGWWIASALIGVKPIKLRRLGHSLGRQNDIDFATYLTFISHWCENPYHQSGTRKISGRDYGLVAIAAIAATGAWIRGGDLQIGAARFGIGMV